MVVLAQLVVASQSQVRTRHSRQFLAVHPELLALLVRVELAVRAGVRVAVRLLLPERLVHSPHSAPHSL